MPPSGDQLILKLLSQFVARLESGGKKRKWEEEVTVQKSVKKVKRCELEAVTIKADMIESLVVHHHLKEVSPNLADEFSALHTFPRVLNHLIEVSPHLAEDLLSFQRLAGSLPNWQKIILACPKPTKCRIKENQ